MRSRSSDASWRDRYAAKTLPLAAAIDLIGRGERIFIGAGCGEPEALVGGLCSAGGRLADNEVYHLLTIGSSPYTVSRFAETFRHNSFFIGPEMRADVAEGRADYTPAFLSEVPRLFTSGRIPIDVALIQLSPPDEHGNCSFGVAVDVTKAAAESARIRIAQINPRMPRTLGDCFIHIDRLDAVVEVNEPILTYTDPDPTEVTDELGRQVAKLIHDGCCLQIGIGAGPTAVLHHLWDRKDLGLHSEMITDAVVDLMVEGVITNQRKRLHRGKTVASFCMGSPKLYSFVHDNPQCEFRPSDYTNDPFVIGQNDLMVAVNAALEVDLTGQVCADSLGYKFYSGIGGQLDFIRGAGRSRGGKPIICLPSCTSEGASRIVSHLSEGAGVVTTRGDVHYVVTEYGAAYLHGRSIRERAMSLIEIAHPEHRAELMALAKERHYVFFDQVPPSVVRYPDELERWVALPEGIALLLRPVRPTDDPLLRDLFYAAGDRSVYQRFMATKPTYPRHERDGVVNIDYYHTMSIAASFTDDEAEVLVALVEWRLDSHSNFAEVAFLVRDEWQGRGLGSQMMAYCIELAMERGIDGFTADVLTTNRHMLDLFERSGHVVRTKLEDDVLAVVLEFDPDKVPPHGTRHRPHPEDPRLPNS